MRRSISMILSLGFGWFHANSANIPAPDDQSCRIRNHHRDARAGDQVSGETKNAPFRELINYPMMASSYIANSAGAYRRLNRSREFPLWGPWMGIWSGAFAVVENHCLVPCSSTSLTSLACAVPAPALGGRCAGIDAPPAPLHPHRRLAGCDSLERSLRQGDVHSRAERPAGGARFRRRFQQVEQARPRFRRHRLIAVLPSVNCLSPSGRWGASSMIGQAVFVGRLWRVPCTCGSWVLMRA